MSSSAVHDRPAAVSVGTGQRSGANIGLHLAFVAALCCLAVGYFGSYVSLVDIWAHSGTFEYAFLIFPICAVVAWSRRHALAQVPGLPRPRILGLMAALVLIWLAGVLADVNLLQHVAVVAILPVLVYTFYGPRVSALLAFPMGYVFFAIPFGNFMVGPLQDITAQMSVWLMHFTDVPVYKTGRYIHTPAAAWHVAEACSGVKFFFATTAFGVLYAFLFFTSLRRRLIFVACAMLVPIIANALRVFFTILIGEKFGIEYASGTDHMIFGWQFFGTVMVLLFFAGWPFHEPPKDPLAGMQDRPTESVPSRRILSTTVLCLGVLISAPLWFHISQAVAAAHSQTPVLDLPETMAGHSRDSAASAPNPGSRFVDPDARTTAFYSLADGAARVERVAYNGRPGENRELITFGNRLFDPNRWSVTARRHVEAAAGVPAHTRLSLASKRGSARVEMRYATRVGDHWPTSSIWLKGWQLFYGLIGVAAPTELVAISQPAAAGSDAASSGEAENALSRAVFLHAASRGADAP